MTIPLAIIVICFALLNQDIVTLTFFPDNIITLPDRVLAFREFDVPAYIIIFGLFFIGFLLGGFASLPKLFSAKRRARKFERAFKKLEKEKLELIKELKEIAEEKEEMEKSQSTAMVIDMPSTLLKDGTL